jgi:hypothetical protein
VRLVILSLVCGGATFKIQSNKDDDASALLRLTSHRCRDYRSPQLFCSTTARQTASLLSAHSSLLTRIKPILNESTLVMASRRVCLNALRGAECRSRGASRTVSSNWTAGTCQRSIHTPRSALRLPQLQARVLGATRPSWQRTRRTFSASPMFRHGHLDPPRPGEE